MEIGRYAIVRDGVVENVILWDGDASTWQNPDGTSVIAISEGDPVAPSYTYDGSKFIAPPIPPM